MSEVVDWLLLPLINLGEKTIPDNIAWQGFFAPAGTSQDVIVKLSTEINNTLKSPEIQEYFGSRGFIIEGNSPTEFKTFIEAEVLKWSRIVKESGAKPD